MIRQQSDVFDTREEAAAFVQGAEMVNDSALSDFTIHGELGSGFYVSWIDEDKLDDEDEE